MAETLKAKFDQIQAQSEDLYQFLNNYRDWVNNNVVNYEIYLEDEWFDDKTVIEYTFRCLDTLNILVFAQDDYQNHRDEKGVWHLGEYTTTYWTVDHPWQQIEAFIQENPAPRYREPRPTGQPVSREEKS